MATLDFETEKNNFRSFYDLNYQRLNDAKNSYIALINALITHDSTMNAPKVDGRVKDKEECIKKFSRKYRSRLEEKELPYEIREYIADLIGLRVVCLYEDDIEKISVLLKEHFEIIDITDKITELESTEASFGYKGLHLDLRLSDSRKDLPEYAPYSEFNFEIQIRTIIQDSWSVLDHKIKYKKSIPNSLKRRINVLAALFELADREFREIRESTHAEIEKANVEDEAVITETEQPQSPDIMATRSELNAFNFLKIGGHFFVGYEFEPRKADGFVHDIHEIFPGIAKSTFHNYINKNIAKVKTYKEHFEEGSQKESFTPYTVIRHCLYIGDKEIFERILTNAARSSFEEWLSKNA